MAPKGLKRPRKKNGGSVTVSVESSNSCSLQRRRRPLKSSKKLKINSKGGLGVIDCKTWNLAAIGKFIWWIAVKKDHLWVRWVNHIYLKGVPWMTYKPSLNASWAWRKICQTKEVFQTGFATNQWGATDGTYTIQAGYCWLRGQQDKVVWAHDVWNKFNVPKWSFMAWLIRWQRLLTLDRMSKFGMVTDGICFLCGDGCETCTHLFFECRYSAKCVFLLADWLHVSIYPSIWFPLGQWRKLTRFQREVCSAAVNGLAYSLWLQRNQCSLGGGLPFPQLLVDQIKRSIHCRVESFGDLKLKFTDKLWFNSLNRF